MPNRTIKPKKLSTKPTHRPCCTCNESRPIEEYTLNIGKSFVSCASCRLKRQEAQALKEQRKRERPLVKPGHKICPGCKQEKELCPAIFTRDKGNANGFHTYCKECKECHKRQSLKWEVKKKPRKFTVATKEDHKICRKCNEELPLNDFRICRRKRNGYKPQYEPYCFKCEAQRAHDNFRKDPEKSRAKGRKFRSIHGDRIRKSNRDKYWEDPEKARAIAKIKNQKPERKEKNNKYNREKRKNDPLYRLSCILRSNMYKIMKNKKFTKNQGLHDYLGCSLDELLRHIEYQWHPHMSWDNYGKGKDQWSVDHTVAMNLAKTEEEIYGLSHFSNLKPMWSLYNSMKHNKTLEEWEKFKAEHNIDESIPPFKIESK